MMMWQQRYGRIEKHTRASILLSALLLWFGCVTFACGPGPKGPCLTSEDCPKGEFCIGTNCLGAPKKDASQPPPPPEPPGEGTTERTPEPSTPETSTPDASPPEVPQTEAPPTEKIPEESDCSLDVLRSCQHGCGNGTQRCRLNDQGKPAWDTCKPKETNRTCYSGAQGTAGVGECKEGTQTCEGETWGPCIGEVTPTTELCNDGKDNNCNGSTDEKEAGCECKATQTQDCGSDTGTCQKGTQTCSAQGQWGTCIGSVDPIKEVCDGKDNNCDGKIDNIPGNAPSCTVPNSKGPCAVGTSLCQNGQLTCQANAQPSTEICDRIDNDCDGKIDNGVPGTGQACPIKNQQGECAQGTTQCQGNKIACIANAMPITEICRDGKDNDCDGLIDEICGPKNEMASINATGTVNFKTPGILSVTRTGAGVYSITTQDTCGSAYPFTDKVPIFVMPRATDQRSTGAICDAGKYIVTIGTTTPIDTPFFVALPGKRTDEAYGSVSYFCNNNDCTIHYSQRGNALIHRIAPGTYEIDSTYCKSANQPYFVQVYWNKIVGHATMYYASPGKCHVKIYDIQGAASDLISFSYWIPSTTAMAWATIDQTGKVVAANTFGDQSAVWTSKINMTGMTFSNLEVAFPAWNANSVPVISPNANGPFSISLSTKMDGIIAHPYRISGIKTPSPLFSVMFLQP